MSDDELLPSVSRRRTALINLAFHYSSILFTLTHAIVLVPLYLKSISTALFGGWLATGNVMAWVELADPGLSAVLQQRLAAAYGAGQTRKIAKIIGTGVTISAFLALVPFLLWPIAHRVGPFLNLSPEDSDILTGTFKLSLVALAFTLASYGPTAANLGLQRSVTPGLIHVGSSLVGLVVTITLLLMGYGLPSLPIGMISRASVLFFGNVGTVLYWSNKHLPQRPYFDREEFRAVLGITAFTFSSRLGGALLGRLDSVLLSRLINPESAALLALTTRTYDPVRMVGERVGPALLPSLSHLGGQSGAEKIAMLTSRLLSAVGWVIAIGVGGVIALNRAFISLWIGPEFFGGQALTIAAGIAVILSILLSIVAQSVFAMGGIRQTAFISVVEAAVKLPLQIFLAPIIGLIAMPLCALGASLAVGAWWLPREAAKLAGTTLSHEAKPIALASVRALVLGAAGWGIGLQLDTLVQTWTWPTFIAAVACVALVLAALLYGIDASLRSTVSTLIKRVRSRQSQLET